jgi:hypothetical protein
MTSTMGGETSRGLNGGSQQGEKLQQAATGLMDQAARTAEAQASTTMTTVGDTLSQVSRAIRDAGNGLRQEQPQIAGVADTAAERVDEFASYLRDHEAGEAIENIQEFARRQPALVVGGGHVHGLRPGRVLRSGSSSMQRQNAMQPYGAYGSSGYGDNAGGGYGSTGTGYGASPAGYAATGAGASYAGTAAAATGTTPDVTATGYAGTDYTGIGTDADLTTAGTTMGTAGDTGVADLADDDLLADETRPDTERGV